MSDFYITQLTKEIAIYLPVDDIFSRNKIGTLVFTLERLIVFLEEYGKANEHTLHSLKVKLSGYQKISARELKRRSASSHTTVQNYIHRFQEKFYPSIPA